MGEDTYPTSGENGFIGTDGFLLTTGAFRGASSPDVGYNWAFWLFQWAFAATTATSELPLPQAYGKSNVTVYSSSGRTAVTAAVAQQYPGAAVV